MLSRDEEDEDLDTVFLGFSSRSLISGLFLYRLGTDFRNPTLLFSGVCDRWSGLMISGNEGP